MFANNHGVYKGDHTLTGVSLFSVGLALVILGFILAFVAVILLAVKASSRSGSSRRGGVLLIGPIPIIFASDRESAKILMVLAVVLIVVVLVFMLLPSLLLTR